jgi:iduronate 2-sulfatase
MLWLAAPALGEHFQVYILAGQSNMDGRGKKAELTGPLAPYAHPQADVRIAYSNSTRRGPYTSGGFKHLQPGYSIPPGTKKLTDPGPPHVLPGRTFGPEVSFGRALADALPNDRIALIKFSEGGTSLAKDWSPDLRGALYDQFLAFTRKALESLTADGHTWELAGMAWHQGESDASLPEGGYQKLLAAFIVRVRDDLDAPKLPFVIGEVFDNGKRDHVRAGQQTVSATTPHVFFVSCAGLRTFDKGTHFDAASQIELGRRMADALLQRASIESPATSPAVEITP